MCSHPALFALLGQLGMGLFGFPSSTILSYTHELASGNMLRAHISILITLVMTVLTVPAIAQNFSHEPVRPAGFYERKAEGWFWYQEDVPEEEPEPEAPPPPIAAIAEPPESEPVQEVPAPPKGPTVFSAAWFRENLPKYRDAAWDDPSIENVRTFMYLQRYAMDKSEQFADASELAVIGDPFLDEEARRPSATFASQNLDRWAGRYKDELSQKLAEKVGLFFFFRSDSDSSRVQAPIVKMLENRDGFTVLPISVDGQPLPDGLFPDFRVNEGQAEAMGVDSLPAIYIVSKDREVEPISQGVLSLADLKHRIIVASKRRGWISDEEFNKTRPILNLDNNIAAILDSYSYEISDLTMTSETGEDENNFIPPEQLGEFIKQKLREGR